MTTQVKAQKVLVKTPDGSDVYGLVVGDDIVEVFAQHPMGSGISTVMAGTIHEGMASDAIAPGHNIRTLTDEEWDRGFFYE